MTQFDDYGKSPFHSACKFGFLNIIQFFFQQGVDLYFRTNDADENTGFDVACKNGKLEVIQFFLENGFDINTTDQNGNTCLHKACSGYHPDYDVIQYLLKNGFKNINKKNDYEDGTTALDNLLHIPDGIDSINMRCVFVLIEAGGDCAPHNSRYLIHELRKRIIEITDMRNAIYEKWHDSLAREVVHFVMDPFTETSLENLTNFISAHE